MDTIESHRIRPAGRHLLTIGEDLIHDQHAAVLELVKNAYDADAHCVDVSIMIADDEDSVVITIADDGHGMSNKTVVNHWLVPSTQHKLTNRLSPGGRTMQGRKGIGRYAASILGTDLLLETISSNGEKTEIYLQWDKFRDAEFLSDVEILVKSGHVADGQGTRLTIKGGGKYRTAWNIDQIQSLQFELRKLISPIEAIQGKKSGKSTFKITLTVDGFFYESNRIRTEEILPLPFFELYDYRISGSIDTNGIGTLKFSNQKARNTIDENIQINLGHATKCGSVNFDLRVYDREPDAIDQIIRRGLKDNDGNYMGKNEAKNLLNKNNGIGVYRNGFRIRPLGDPDFDWLKLNEKRVQMPSMRIGSNQVIGYVEIQSEELSHLEEKSARDGLKENEAFASLKEITNWVIARLEERRFTYRSKAGLSRSIVKVEKEFESLFDFEDMKVGVRRQFEKTGLDKKLAEEIVNLISKKEEESNRIVEDIRRAVAVYQGQATLGKIINVILHEGRKPLNYFKNQIPNLHFWISSFDETKAREFFAEILPIADGIGKNSEHFVSLFGKLDPLAAGKRKPKDNFEIVDALRKSFSVFEDEMIQQQISLTISPSGASVKYYGWPADIYIIMTNLIENSIYWMTAKQSHNKKISVDIVSNGQRLEYIDYRDSGPGIEKHLIESQVVFEPEFSTKPSGTGLGLAIAGEAAYRNGLQIQAFESSDGAYFRLQPISGGV